VACGFGGNALYLASLGYSVQGVDVSGFALSRAQAEAQRRGLQIGFVQADLTHWWLPAARYDLIVVFFYLNRTLLPRLAAALRNGGLLFQVNRNWRFLEERPSFDPDYLLQPGELCRMARASRLTVLHYTDGTSDHRHNSQLIARRCH
jgi:SAM-dependent methyltransferase